MRISVTNILLSACLLAAPIEAKSSSMKATKSSKSTLPALSSFVAAAPVVQSSPSRVQLPDAAKLVIGAGGIYAAFLYYGTLQEDVFHYVAADGSKFKAAWFLQTLGENAYRILQTKVIAYSNVTFFFL